MCAKFQFSECCIFSKNLVVMLQSPWPDGKESCWCFSIRIYRVQHQFQCYLGLLEFRLDERQVWQQYTNGRRSWVVYNSTESLQENFMAALAADNYSKTEKNPNIFFSFSVAMKAHRTIRTHFINKLIWMMIFIRSLTGGL